MAKEITFLPRRLPGHRSAMTYLANCGRRVAEQSLGRFNCAVGFAIHRPCIAACKSAVSRQFDFRANGLHDSLTNQK
jgi:hypothetical protein